MFVSSVKFVSSPLPPTHPTQHSVSCRIARGRFIVPHGGGSAYCRPRKSGASPRAFCRMGTTCSGGVYEYSTGLSPPSPTTRTRRPLFPFANCRRPFFPVRESLSLTHIPPLLVRLSSESARLVHGCACGGAARQYWLSEGGLTAAAALSQAGGGRGGGGEGPRCQNGERLKGYSSRGWKTLYRIRKCICERGEGG